MTRFCWLFALVAVACNSSDPEAEKRKREAERAAFLDGLTHLCDEDNPTQAPQLAAYHKGAGRHGVAAMERDDDRGWSPVGSARPAGAATPQDPQQVEAVACIDTRKFLREDECSFEDESGNPMGGFKTGRGIATIRFVEPKTGNVLLEKRLESKTAPKPCPYRWVKGDDLSPYVTPVPEAEIDAVLEQFRTGALVPGTI